MEQKEIWLTGENRTIKIVLTPLGERKTEVFIQDSAAAYSEEEVWNLPLPRVERILEEFYEHFLK